MQVKLPYHIRVLIPCYKEDLEIVQKTILAARTAIPARECGAHHLPVRRWQGPGEAGLGGQPGRGTWCT